MCNCGLCLVPAQMEYYAFAQAWHRICLGDSLGRKDWQRNWRVSQQIVLFTSQPLFTAFLFVSLCQTKRYLSSNHFREPTILRLSAKHGLSSWFLLPPYPLSWSPISSKKSIPVVWPSFLSWDIFSPASRGLKKTTTFKPTPWTQKYLVLTNQGDVFSTNGSRVLWKLKKNKKTAHLKTFSRPPLESVRIAGLGDTSCLALCSTAGAHASKAGCYDTANTSKDSESISVFSKTRAWWDVACDQIRLHWLDGICGLKKINVGLIFYMWNSSSSATISTFLQLHLCLPLYLSDLCAGPMARQVFCCLLFLLLCQPFLTSCCLSPTSGGRWTPSLSLLLQAVYFPSSLSPSTLEGNLVAFALFKATYTNLLLLKLKVLCFYCRNFLFILEFSFKYPAVFDAFTTDSLHISCHLLYQLGMISTKSWRCQCHC